MKDLGDRKEFQHLKLGVRGGTDSRWFKRRGPARSVALLAVGAVGETIALLHSRNRCGRSSLRKNRNLHTKYWLLRLRNSPFRGRPQKSLLTVTKSWASKRGERLLREG